MSSARRHRLAAWAFADLVINGVAPYFDLPSTASDPTAARAADMPRATFAARSWRSWNSIPRPADANDLLGMVAFLNSTTSPTAQGGEQLFDHFAPGAGAGLRVLLNKRSRTNLAFDIGFGENGNRGVYLVVQEAF